MGRKKYNLAGFASLSQTDDTENCPSDHLWPKVWGQKLMNTIERFTVIEAIYIVLFHKYMVFKVLFLLIWLELFFTAAVRSKTLHVGQVAS